VCAVVAPRPGLEAEQLLAVRLARLQEISDLALARFTDRRAPQRTPGRIAALLECDTVRILLLDESRRELVESGGTAFDAGRCRYACPLVAVSPDVSRSEPNLSCWTTSPDRRGRRVLRGDVRSAVGVPYKPRRCLVSSMSAAALRVISATRRSSCSGSRPTGSRGRSSGAGVLEFERAARERSEFPRTHQRATDALAWRSPTSCDGSCRPPSPAWATGANSPCSPTSKSNIRGSRSRTSIPTSWSGPGAPGPIPLRPRRPDRHPGRWRTGTTQYYPDINDELIALAVPDPDARAVLRQLHVRSMINSSRAAPGISAPLQTRPGPSPSDVTPPPTYNWPRCSQRASDRIGERAALRTRTRDRRNPATEPCSHAPPRRSRVWRLAHRTDAPVNSTARRRRLLRRDQRGLTRGECSSATFPGEGHHAPRLPASPGRTVRRRGAPHGRTER